MLHKDQYNEDEYNDYYQKEVRGAELGKPAKTGGLISKLIILLILLAIAIASYFGYKALSSLSINESNKSNSNDAVNSALPQSIQKLETSKEEEVTKKEETSNEKNTENKKEEIQKTEEEVIQKEKKEEEKNTTTVKEVAPTEEKAEATKVVEEVNKVVDTQAKMSPEEIAAVVQAVMQQLQKKEQESSVSESAPSAEKKKDLILMDELSSSEVDSVSANLVKELENIELDSNTEVHNEKKQINVYNKVNVQNVSGVDSLSDLSNQITAVMNEGMNEDKEESYTKSLKTEIDVRKNEMRIIVVREGDTLGKIAQRAYGNVMDFKKIYQANPEITRPDRIYIGQKLRIPN